MKDITMKFNKIIALLVFIAIWLPACNDAFLEEHPKDELSDETFWKNEKDANRALMGCYRGNGDTRFWWEAISGWDTPTIFFSEWTDIATDKALSLGAYPREGILPSSPTIEGMWAFNYEHISNCNYFLENIDKADMDSEKKAEMIAEVKFLRGYSYFWLSQLYGNIPLIKKVLTFEEANSMEQSSQDEVMNFVLNDLTKAAEDLPEERPDAERGRVEKGAALALKGRFLMAQEKWSDAADTYEEIMDLGRYKIDPRFKKLFEDEGDNSDEIIFARVYKEGDFGEPNTQLSIPPGWIPGKFSKTWASQRFVDKFLVNDGEPIEDSPLYDSENPFDNRDPRLYATVYLPNYTEIPNGFQGSTVFQGHPDSLAKVNLNQPGVTGYGFRKFFDEEYTGDTFAYGGDYPLIRYAEVLLSRLESELKAGNTIDQNLLDNTINKVRQRDEVGMPPVVVGEDYSNDDELMDILDRERCVELAFEGGIRYWDLLRWEKLDDVLSKPFYGMKITDNPDEYTGTYVINDEGHYFIRDKNFESHNYLWPIPQRELDVNPNLKQNPGY